MKLKHLAWAVSTAVLSTTVAAQTSNEPTRVERVEITGSSIKRVQTEGALPVQVVTKEQLDQAGIVSAEQFISLISTFGNDIDNLASNSDVAAGTGRGNNGLSAANLRGQGSNATLVLLNGRRLAVHGLAGGSAVDLNQIPMAAVARIEVLKDGASAIYGTDAIGGVVNFILRKDYRGVDAQGSIDVTEAGGGDIYRASVSAGFGSLTKDRYNVLFSVAHRENKILRGRDRDFVNTFQPERGLHVDTRGAPFATAFAIASIRTILSSRNAAGVLTNGLGPLEGSVRMNGINALNMPGMPGCDSIPGMADYDEVLWAFPSAKYGCAWDTGKAAALQQPVKNTSGVARAVFQVTPTITAHLEATAAKTTSMKEFSNNQISSSNLTTSPFFRLVYPATGSSYDYVFNAIARLFPSIQENYGQPIAYRWRCMPCGPRQIETETDTARLHAGIEGAFGNWDYKAGFSHAYSDAKSILKGGYYFNDKFVPLLSSGLLNPFVPPGQSQKPEALTALAAASATGTTLYGGRSSVDQFDGSASGPIWKLPAGDVLAAVGFDIRKEKYRFNGNETDLATQRNIFNAPFDSVNTLAPVSRDIKAVYTELAVPVLKSLEVTAAVRHDRYSGFGGTTNPKFTFRFNPSQQFLLRGSYSEGFRVPTFSQLFFGVTESPYSGKDLVDPFKCPSLTVSTTNPNCFAINPNILNGGKPNLQPETAKMHAIGGVFEPFPALSLAADYWYIQRKDNIRLLGLTTLVQNAALFPEVFIRNAAGEIVQIDQRWVNTGEQITRGIDLSLRGRTQAFGGTFDARLDGTYLIERKSRLLVTQPFGPNEVGKFTRGSELPIRWKHTLSVSYNRGPWTGTLSQRFSKGYLDAVLPGVESGDVRPPKWSPKTADYSIFDLFVSYRGIKNLVINAGVKNILDKDPPFSATYDSDTGAGSSWEPRVADPRGRAYVLNFSYSFK